MSLVSKLIKFSKKIASELLKEEESASLNDSNLFNAKDKDYIFENLMDESLKEKRKQLANQIDIDEDWNIVNRKTNTSYKKSIFWKYAAAAILICGFVSSYYILNKTTTLDIEPDTTVSHSKKTIVTGSDKALLTLEDGSSIELEKGKSFHTNTIQSNGEKIVYQKPTKKSTKPQFHYLTIPRGGQYYIELSDGTKVWLNSESQLKFPVSFIENKPRKVELIYGEAYFDVSPSTEHNGSKFLVINKSQEIEVLGTEFNIKAYKDESHIYTTLVEGKVCISNNSMERINLIPNQQSILNTENNNIEITPIDVENEIAWKQGLFKFKGKKLKEIMKVISRWYDVEIVFSNQDIEEIKFKGVLDKNQNIEEILFSIQSLSSIKEYTIQDKTIILK